MNDLEKTLRALANGRRLAIIKYIHENKEASVGEIARAIHLSFRSTSRHLAILTHADILETDKRSSQVFYRIVLPMRATVKHILSLV